MSTKTSTINELSGGLTYTPVIGFIDGTVMELAAVSCDGVASRQAEAEAARIEKIEGHIVKLVGVKHNFP